MMATACSGGIPGVDSKAGCKVIKTGVGSKAGCIAYRVTRTGVDSKAGCRVTRRADVPYLKLSLPGHCLTQATALYIKISCYLSYTTNLAFFQQAADFRFVSVL